MAADWIGPFSPNEFLKELMPITDEVLGQMRQDVKFSLPVHKDDAQVESHLYELFEKTIRDYELSSKFKFFIIVDDKSKGGDIAYRPDGGFKELSSMLVPTCDYNTRAKTQTTEGLDPADETSKESAGQGQDERKAFNWSQDGLVVVFKKFYSLDPFWSTSAIEKAAASRKGDKKNMPVTFPKLTDSALKVRGQLAIYANYAFTYQHRTHLFQLLVCGRHARFLFWDHSGAIVSDSFDYVQQPLLLAEFFWRYNYMTPAARGWDASVKLANPDQKKKFATAVKQLLKNMKDPKHPQYNLPHADHTLDEHHPVFKITVVDDVTGMPVDVLVQRPFFRSHSALGRATRGYIAYHPTQRILMFLKDTWRVDHNRLIPERTLCRQLVEAEVPFVPQIIWGGDVLVNEERGITRCLKWAAAQTLPVGLGHPRVLVQHRMLSKLAYPVTSAPNSSVMVKGFRDSIVAMDKAKELCNLVHRDISIGNIMLTGDKDCKGILADWDHAGKAEPPVGVAP
ncbi:hypothetical protein BDY19DRAFT_101525 [Irpex rosettiformis]|uniref:Uncharacterized protein n=1 Tax=Irpex rosettiformis TaxID=378272 RepID=A0ACB8U532_9APHY|nr:hypothetical protein BDY19DRAFT_101525 [Irpex rosettiformis]